MRVLRIVASHLFLIMMICVFLVGLHNYNNPVVRLDAAPRTEYVPLTFFFLLAAARSAQVLRMSLKETLLLWGIALVCWLGFLAHGFSESFFTVLDAIGWSIFGYTAGQIALFIRGRTP